MCGDFDDFVDKSSSPTLNNYMLGSNDKISEGKMMGNLFGIITSKQTII